MKKLYWFVKTADDRYQYKFATVESLMKKDLVDGQDFVVVHPNNKIFKEEYREYNKQFLKEINEIHEARIAKLEELKAPEFVLEHEKKHGPYSKGANLLDK